MDVFFPSYAFFFTLEKLDAFRKAHWERPFQGGPTANLTKRCNGVESVNRLLMISQSQDFSTLVSFFPSFIPVFKEQYHLRC